GLAGLTGLADLVGSAGLVGGARLFGGARLGGSASLAGLRGFGGFGLGSNGAFRLCGHGTGSFAVEGAAHHVAKPTRRGKTSERHRAGQMSGPAFALIADASAATGSWPSCPGLRRPSSSAPPAPSASAPARRGHPDGPPGRWRSACRRWPCRR